MARMFRSDPRRSVTGSLSFAFWRDRLGNFVKRPDMDGLTRRLKVVDAGVPGPKPGGLPGLTDAEAEAFLAAIDKSTPASPNRVDTSTEAFLARARVMALPDHEALLAHAPASPTTEEAKP